MKRYSETLRNILERALPWLVLVILLIYTYARFFEHPYGISWDSNGVIYDTYVKQEPSSLQIGDQIVEVGQLSWRTFHADLYRTLFEGVSPGTIVQVIINRGGEFITIPWKLPGTNKGEVLDQLISDWFLAYIFWLVGTFSILFIRPKDDRWLLFSGFNFITAIWLISGGGTSNYHIWGSAIVLRMAIWLSIPIYLHMHWVFPKPLGKLSPPLISVGYTIALGLMIAQFYQLLPPYLYFAGFLVAILGSFILLIAHAFRQPEARLDLQLFLVAIILTLLPLIVVLIINLMIGPTRIDALALLSFPLLPLTYLFAAYRNQLGGVEIRVNHIISVYSFLILVCTLGIPLMDLLNILLPSPTDNLINEVFVIVLTSIASIWVFPRFQDFVGHRWLGISLPTKNLSEIYASRLATSNSFIGLENLLRDEILPSLLIKQFVFMQTSKPPRAVFLIGINQKQIPDEQLFNTIVNHSGIYHSSSLSDREDPYSWIRFTLPLKVGDDLIGIWLFGRRDPDDYYSKSEISILESLANQTAIAVSNILQSERLKAVYQADINRHENERLNLARDLHDTILNRLAALMMNLNDASLTPEFQKAYDKLTASLRETVTNLRPPLLDYGLRAALNELADNLMELSQDKLEILVELESGNPRYDSLIELYVFRIIQEACGNSLHHGLAKKIWISGNLEPRKIKLSVKDDGIGFNTSLGLALNDLIANGHFGLAGMVERAELIGANLNIVSKSQVGTIVEILLTANGSQLM